MVEHECPIIFKTHGPGHHFFGYYDKSPLDINGERLLTHRADFDFKRMPKPTDEINIGYWSIADGEYHQLATTKSFNWQQGSQLQWLGPDFSTKIIFNDRTDDHFISRIIDVETKSEQCFSYPIYTVHPNGRSAICVNYERIFFPRPGYRYEGIVKQKWNKLLPEGDGLFRLDLESGDLKMVISTKQLFHYKHVTSMEGCIHYLEHALMSPDGRRFCFFHVWQLSDGGFYTRLYSADEYGKEIRLLSDGGMVSHCGWRGLNQITAWARPVSTISNLRKNQIVTTTFIKRLLPTYHWFHKYFDIMPGKILGETYFIFHDGKELKSERLAPQIQFKQNGHGTWRPGDKRWFLTDTYEDKDFYRNLLLFDYDNDELIRIGKFYSLPETCSTGFRCDLHPRWSHDGKIVCIDSIHDKGDRQMYLIDTSTVI